MNEEILQTFSKTWRVEKIRQNIAKYFEKLKILSNLWIVYFLDTRSCIVHFSMNKQSSLQSMTFLYYRS